MTLVSRAPRDTSAFLTSLLTRLFWSVNESARGMNNAKLLDIASSVIRTHIWPVLKDAREDYVTAVFDVPAASSGGSTFESGNSVSLPSQSYLQISKVWYYPGDSASDLRHELTYCKEEDLYRRTQGFPYYYFFRGGRLYVEPYPTTGYFRIKFHAQPFDLVELSTDNAYLTVSSYSGDNIVMTSALPSGWDATDADYVVVSATPPHVPVAWIARSNVTSHVASTLGIDAATQFPSSTRSGGPAPINPGDLVMELPDSCIVQCPEEAYEFLLQKTVLDVAVARSDTSKIQAIEKTIGAAYDSFLSALQPRETEEGQVYVPQGRMAPVGYGRYRG